MDITWILLFAGVFFLLTVERWFRMNYQVIEDKNDTDSVSKKIEYICLEIACFIAILGLNVFGLHHYLSPKTYNGYLFPEVMIGVLMLISEWFIYRIAFFFAYWK